MIWEYIIENRQLLLFGVFAVAAFIQLVYHLLIFLRLAFYQPKNTTDKKEGVSIVISAKNEEYRLERFLPKILEQDYPEYEVVVVNDCSDDDSKEVLKQFQKTYPHLKVVNLVETRTFIRGKKFPLSIGIRCAKHEWLLFTDADCEPASNQWLRNMQRHFTEDKSIVLGYGKYFKEKGLTNKLIRFDTFFIALQYLSLAISGMPYMGVGRNMAYRKSLFLKGKGFSSHYGIPSGDDDLFVNEHARRKNTKIEISKESFTASIPKQSFAQWFAQKRRHLTTGGHYRRLHKIVLSTYLISQWIFYLSFILLMIFPHLIYICLGIFGLRLTSQFLSYGLTMRQLEEKDLIPFSILFELFFMIFNPIVYISTLISKPSRWK